MRGGKNGFRRFWIAGDREMIVHNLPSALFPLAPRGDSHPHLRRRVIFWHPCEVKKPVRDRQITAHGKAEVSHLNPEGVREARQARLPRPSKFICTFDWERRYCIENNHILGVVRHDAIEVFGADGTGRICDDLSNLRFLLCFGGFGCHSHRGISLLMSIGFPGAD